MFGEHLTIGQAVTVCIFSITVVFLVLFSITLLINITAKIVNRKKPEKQAPAPVTKTAPAPAETPQVKDDSQTALIAAAAIAAYLGKSADQIIVRSITPVHTPESNWSRESRLGSLQ